MTVDRAARGEAYLCPNCGEPFVFRAGPRRRRHFAHKAGVAGCALESVLHQAGKVAVHSVLQARLREQAACVATWTCHVCGRGHTLNLLAGVAKVALEHPLGEVRPDIALLDCEARVLRVVEIVVTHEPEDAAWQTYSAGGIPVFCVKVDEKTVESLLQPDNGVRCYKVVGVECPTPKCPSCHSPLYEVVLVLVKDYPCWRCGRPMRAAYWRTDCGYVIWQWARFLPRQALALMRSHGIRLEHAGSSVVRERHWRQVCPHCGAMQGDHYIPECSVDRAAEEQGTGLLWCHECGRVFFGLQCVATTDGATWAG